MSRRYYVEELLKAIDGAMTAEQRALAWGGFGNGSTQSAQQSVPRSDAPRKAISGEIDVISALEATRKSGQWHNHMRDAIAHMVAKGWPDQAIYLACAPYCERGAADRDLTPLIGTARRKWGKPDPATSNPPINVPPPTDLRLIPSAEFLANFQPPDYLIEGVIQKGCLYAMTGPTGHGKTSVALLMAVCMATGNRFAGHQTERSRIAYFAGENPDDVRGRAILAAEQYDLRGANLWFIDRSFDIRQAYDAIVEACTAVGHLDAVVIDTAAAFNGGDDENSNAQQVAYARALRGLTMDLPGRPTIIILCHPTKNAQKDFCIPRGGGAFVAEVDGNMRLWSDDETIAELEPHHKFRGAAFQPLQFEMERHTSDKLRDSKGREIPYILAHHIDEDRASHLTREYGSDQDTVLQAMLHCNRASLADLCRHCRWTNPISGTPHKGKMHKVLKKLREEKLVRQDRKGVYVLTNAGRDEAASGTMESENGF